MLQEILRQARLICSSESMTVFWSSINDRSDMLHEETCHHVLLSLLALKCILAQPNSRLSQEQAKLLKGAGISASKNLPAEHVLLRPRTRRHSHKHKRHKKRSKRRRTEGMMPLSSEEDLSDSELGIMRADSADNLARTDITWTLTCAGRTYSTVSEHDIPEVVLRHVLLQWLSCVFSISI